VLMYDNHSLAMAELESLSQGGSVANQIVRESNAELMRQLEDLLRQDVKGSDKNAGDILTYGHGIMASLVYENYDKAIADLDALLGLRKDYPRFGVKASPYVQHAKSLVRAIKTKRAVGRSPHLTRSKQKELMSALTFHFKEFRNCILNIEKIERHARKEDLSSTRWFVLTLYFCIMLVFSVALIKANIPEIFVAIYQLINEWVSWLFVFLSQWLWPHT
jgi:hypothetical protein